MSLLFLAIGLGAGILSGLFGLGGGIIIVPALLFLAKMPAHSATGTSLGALVLPVGALGAWSYWKAGHLDVRVSLLIALGLFFGAFFGAKLSELLTAVQLKRAFAVLLLLVAARMLWDTRTRPAASPPGASSTQSS